MLRSTLRLSALLSSVTFAACTAAEPTDTAAGDDTAAADTALPGTDLLGSWASACYANTQTTLTYTETGFVGTYDEYTDDTCTTAYHHSAWSGTYVAGAPDSAGIAPLDLAFLSFTSTALTEENAAQNNAWAYCGFTDWAAGVEKDILGADCYGFSIPEGGESLDIYRIVGDALTFGQGATIGTDLDASARPTALDETRVFTRR